MLLEMLLVGFIGLYSQCIAKLEVKLEYITLSMMILWSKYDYMGVQCEAVLLFTIQ